MNRRQFKRTFRTVFAVIVFAVMLALTDLGSSGPGGKPNAKVQAAQPQSKTALHSLSQARRLLADERAAPWQTTSRPAQPQLLDFEKLTEQQFKQLPDSQRIMFDGKQTTLGEVRAKVRARQQQMAQKRAASQAKIVGNKATSPVRTSIDQLVRSQQQKFSAENAQLQTELKRLRQLGKTTTEIMVSTQKQSGIVKLPPRITKVLGIIQPGGVVLIGGNNFGNTPGRVRMIVSASVELLLENLEWHPTSIGGWIPNDPNS